jgi:alpha,alpha-trehalase
MKHGMALLLILAMSPSASAASSQELSQLLVKAKATENIVKPAKGILKYEYLVPAGAYYQLFDWDMYFMGVALSYSHVWEPVVGSVKDFLEFVNARFEGKFNVEGYVPREISPDSLWTLPHQAKPFLAQAALLASQQSGSYGWLKDYYPKLKYTIRYWEQARRANDGLFVWFDGLESGTDNTPAILTDQGDLNTEGVDLQVYIYREYLALAILGDKLGDKDAGQFRQSAQRLKETMLREMWSEQDGVFYNKSTRTNAQIKIKSWTSFTPLWAQMVPKDKAERMIKDHLLSKEEYWAPHGIRSIPLHAPTYDPKNGYWQGPVWVISNYLLMHGLMNYGFKAEAQELAHKTVDLLAADLKATGGG